VSVQLQIHGTALSHFTRKLRILCAELGIEHEFVRTATVMSESRDAYASNPLSGSRRSCTATSR
jgi:glutathione S-transferase